MNANLLNQVFTGDAKGLTDQVAPASIDLIFTDPVYEQVEDYHWLATVAKRISKPKTALLTWQAITFLDKTLAAVTAAEVEYRWMIAHLKLNRVKEKFGSMGFCKWEPCIWFDPCGPTPRRRSMDVFNSVAFASGPSRHPWSKALDVVEKILLAFTKPGATVFDPFTGSGVVPVACKRTGRNFIAFEIDERRAAIARQWLGETSPPLYAAPETVLIQQKFID
jgi:DNA modification methylase